MGSVDFGRQKQSYFLGMTSAATLPWPAAESAVLYLRNISSQKRVTCSVVDPNSPMEPLFILLFLSHYDSLHTLCSSSVHSKNLSLALKFIKKQNVFRFVSDTSDTNEMHQNFYFNVLMLEIYFKKYNVPVQLNKN